MLDLAKTLILGAGTGYLLLALLTLLASDFVIFPMPPNRYALPGLLKLPTRDGNEIAALYFSHPQARVTLLYSHGNGEDLESLYPLFEELHRRGFSVLAYDYPGYGRSSGKSSEKSVYAAIDASYEMLTEEQGVVPEEIVLYGRSVGSGPSVDLAVRKPIGGLILEGGFVSAFRVITRRRLLPWDKFENERKLKRVSCPVLVIQGANDEVVGFWHGPRLHAAAPEPKELWRVKDAGHNDLVFVAGDEYWRRLTAFAETVRGPGM